MTYIFNTLAWIFKVSTPQQSTISLSSIKVSLIKETIPFNDDHKNYYHYNCDYSDTTTIMTTSATTLNTTTTATTTTMTMTATNRTTTMTTTTTTFVVCLKVHSTQN